MQLIFLNAYRQSDRIHSMLSLIVILCASDKLILGQNAYGIIDKSSFLVQLVATDKLRMAEQLYIQQDYQRSFSHIEESIRIFPKYKSIHLGLSLVNLFAVDRTEWLRGFLLYHPDNPELMLSLGIETHLKGHFSESIEIYSRMLRQFYQRYGKDIENISNIDTSKLKAPITTSFISDIYFNTAVSYHYSGMIEESSEAYTHCLAFKNDHVSCRLNLAALHHQYGNVLPAIHHYEYILKRFYAPSIIRSLELQMQKSIVNANVYIDSILFKSIDMQINATDSDEVMLVITRVTANREYVMVKSNLGAAYLKYGLGGEARRVLVSLLMELDITATHGGCLQKLINVDKNASFARYTFSLVPRMNSLQLLDALLHRSQLVLEPNVPRTQNCVATLQDQLQTLNNLVLADRASCYWHRMEEHTAILLRYTILTLLNVSAGSTNAYQLGPMLPFDTLLIPVSLHDRLLVAHGASLHILSSASPLPRTVHSEQRSDARGTESGRRALRVGFMSYDFNDHPTAHLVEGIFDTVHTRRISGSSERSPNADLIIFNYGKNDGSSYRLRLEQLADEFIDLSLMSHSDALRVVAESNIDILLDMQLHTFGHRLQIIASHPVPLQVSYLVYPATSGSSFHDLVIGDSHVTPAEHAVHYSESFLLLPPTYQISFYNRHSSSASASAKDSIIASTSSLNEPGQSKHLSLKYQLRQQYDLPASTDRYRVVFCNFNKMDKLDSFSFIVWMNVLQRTPGSVLWLLRPIKYKSSTNTIINTSDSDSGSSRSSYNTEPDEHFDAHAFNTLLEANLSQLARARGVDPRRIVFAPRTSKKDHIIRHAAADLFLDTFVYGAHSTATDALKGGLPVLTAEGGSFPNRVVSSLYSTFDTASSDSALLSQLLIRVGARDFEDAAVTFAKNLVEANSPGHSGREAARHNPPHHKSAILKSLSSILSELSPRPKDHAMTESTYGGGQQHHSAVDTRYKHGGLFDTTTLVDSFLRSMEVAREVQSTKLTRSLSSYYIHSRNAQETATKYEHRDCGACDSSSSSALAMAESVMNSSSEWLGCCERARRHALTVKSRLYITTPHIIVGRSLT